MLSKRIKAAREKAGLKKSEVSKMLEMPYTTYDSYERGKSNPSFETMGKIAKILKIPVGSLTGDEWDASLADDEVELIADYNKLTPEGKEVARERVRELTEIPRYYNPDHGVKIIKGDERQDDTDEK